MAAFGNVVQTSEVLIDWQVWQDGTLRGTSEVLEGTPHRIETGTNSKALR